MSSVVLVGQDIQPKKDLTRFVKWPNTFAFSARRSSSASASKSLPPLSSSRTRSTRTPPRSCSSCSTSTVRRRSRRRRRPLSGRRHRRRCVLVVDGVGVHRIDYSSTQDSKKPLFVKYGLNHTVALIEAKKASLVVIARDVDTIELVVFLSALCRRMGVPYVIVSGRSFTRRPRQCLLSRTSRARTSASSLPSSALRRRTCKSRVYCMMTWMVPNREASSTEKYEEQLVS